MICDAIKGHAAERPKDPALLVQSGPSISYADLERSADHLRAQFQDVGLGPLSRVAIVLPNGPLLAVSIVAVACNATALPLDGRLTAGELEDLFAGLGIHALITAKEDGQIARETASKLGVAIIEASLEDKQLLLKQISGARAKGIEIGRNSVPVMLRTSGTTARQKLVPVTHDYLATMSYRMQRWFDLTPQDRCFCAAPLYYGQGVMGTLLTSLFLGTSVAFDDPGRNFIEALCSSGATWYAAGPTFHRSVMRLASKWRGKPVHNLRFIQTGAAILADSVKREIEDFFGVPVLDAYGMSEAGLIGSNGVRPEDRKPGTVGKPDLEAVAIFDVDGNRLAAGQVGEVVVKGPGVTPGYLLDDAANAANFKCGWFHTGDLASIDEEGFLSLVGRMKEMINRGGEKIAPAEIDLALMKHEAVSEAAAFSVPHATLGDDVAAAVVLMPGIAVSAQELRVFLREQLAPFKVPRRIHFVEVLPKGETGKVQRSQLTASLAPTFDTESAARPRTELERKLLAVWRRVLNREDIGIDDDFFEAGGDSLSGLQMLLEAEALTNKTIVESILFEAPTIRKLAQMIESERAHELPLIIEIQAGKPNVRPLFFFDGVYDGGGYYTRDLAALLGPQQPFYDLRPFQLTEGKLPTVEEMAKEYVALIKSARPQGPYRIGGHCNGGVMAFAVARQLEDMGETVECLIAVEPLSLNARADLRLQAAFADFVSVMTGGDVAKRRAASLIRTWDRILVRDWQEHPSDDGPRRFGPEEAAEALASLMPEAAVMKRQLTRALAGFVPKSIRAPVVCVVAQQSVGSIRFSPKPWRAICRDFRTITVPGAHLSCITTHARALAQELSAVLDG
ncbi:MAG: AMP-binding protein [Alphaproteobacteria bacterium]